MNTKDLMSGIAVVIDDALTYDSPTEGGDDESGDLIRRIVNWFEIEWKLPFVKLRALPNSESRTNLLRSASFVLLDWKFWGSGGEMLKQDVIKKIGDFLISARENLVPVLILTNENIDDVRDELRKLPREVYDEEADVNNFVFVLQKNELWAGELVDAGTIEAWVYGNTSVYALKTWGRVLGSAKSELFQIMSKRSMDWPRVFWKTYREDGADPSASLTNLINDNVKGRMRVDAFDKEYFDNKADDVSREELQRLIAEASFRGSESLPMDEIRCGDLFKVENKKYWLNLRPDCDCIPRDESAIGDVDLHCVEGKIIRPGALSNMFKNGHFEERVNQSIVFGVVDGKSILFDFAKLRVCKYSEVRSQRSGRLLHPYVTRVQQRYALFIQRQALPRIPDAAIQQVP